MAAKISEVVAYHSYGELSFYIGMLSAVGGPNGTHEVKSYGSKRIRL